MDLKQYDIIKHATTVKVVASGGEVHYLGDGYWMIIRRYAL